MMPIFWQRALVRPVEDWDRLDFADCEQLVRGLYRSAGVLPDAVVVVAIAGLAPQSGDGATTRSGRVRGDRQRETGAPIMAG